MDEKKSRRVNILTWAEIIIGALGSLEILYLTTSLLKPNLGMGGLGVIVTIILLSPSIFLLFLGISLLRYKNWARLTNIGFFLSVIFLILMGLMIYSFSKDLFF